jgi:hypothetical protein
LALTPEDGSIVAGADTYVSLEAVETYFAAHGAPTDWTGTNAVKEGALRVARQWIDSAYTWKGGIVDETQALDWPRQGVYDDEGRAVAEDSIPQALKDAQCEAAVEHLRSSLTVPLERAGMLKRERVEGAVEREFMDGAPGARLRSFLTQLLAPLIVSGPGAFRFERA